MGAAVSPEQPSMCSSPSTKHGMDALACEACSRGIGDPIETVADFACFWIERLYGSCPVASSGSLACADWIV